MASATRRRTSVGKRLLLAALGLGLALAAAEVAARAWGALTGNPGPAEFLCHDDRLGWRNRPDFRGRHRTEDFDVVVRFDGEGQRAGAASTDGGGARDEAPPAVLAVGDSTTFGWGVEQRETFAAILAQKLAATVGNRGVTGYGADQQLLLLREALATVAPRLVLVTHTANDVAEVMQSRPYHRYKPRFHIDAGELRLSGQPVRRDWLAESSHLWRTIQKHLGTSSPPELTPADLAIGKDLVARIYREMHRECTERGIGFLLTGQGADWLRDFATRESIPYLDLTPTFKRLAKSGPIRFEHDPHWLPRVHEAVASELQSHIEREQLLHR